MAHKHVADLKNCNGEEHPFRQERQLGSQGKPTDSAAAHTFVADTALLIPSSRCESAKTSAEYASGTGPIPGEYAMQNKYTMLVSSTNRADTVVAVVVVAVVIHTQTHNGQRPLQQAAPPERVHGPEGRDSEQEVEQAEAGRREQAASGVKDAAVKMDSCWPIMTVCAASVAWRMRGTVTSWASLVKAEEDGGMGNSSLAASGSVHFSRRSASKARSYRPPSCLTSQAGDCGAHMIKGKMGIMGNPEAASCGAPEISELVASSKGLRYYARKAYKGILDSQDQFAQTCNTACGSDLKCWGSGANLTHCKGRLARALPPLHNIPGPPPWAARSA
ncbi:hypothetical protein Micbo1qcDRAFT_178239 [Microdochium bolleyi]|uniref:Uncharacterized protein n=1 Tax=Microdochium bolleyi TaxID=196109 RepID=A0A136ISX9_9PEZI|nr:hypothetical protein Micbo1qcDRAFT_178239 [Microdochium bolleyi]